MGPETTIALQIDKDSLKLVLKNFQYMRDEDTNIDYYKPSVPSPDDLKTITRKLETVSADAQGQILTIPMTEIEFGKFCSFLHCASDATPDGYESEFLSDLYYSFSEWEENGFKAKLTVLHPNPA